MAATMKSEGSIKESELIRKIKSAVKEAMSEDGEDKSGDPAGGLASAVDEIVQAVVDDINEKRKSRKDEGEQVEALSENEAAEIAAAVESAIAAALPEEGEKADPEDEEEKGDAPEDESEGEEPKSRGSSHQSKQKKAAGVQRKYADIYMQGRKQMANTQKKEVPPMVKFGRAVKCLDAFGRHDPDRAAFYAKKYYDDEDMARELKALNTTSPSGGGFLIPETYIDQIIELLYAKTVVFELGAQKVPMPNGNVNIPRMTSGARATWGGEQRKIAASQPKFGNLKLFSKRLEAIIPQSRELLMSTTYSADQMFANDLTRRMELGLDFGALFGTGTEYQPLGVVSNTEVQKIDVSKITDKQIAEGGLVTADFPVFMRAQTMAKNIDDQHLGWAFNSLVEGYLMNLKTATGTYIYRDEMQNKKLLGSPYRISNQIPLTEKGTDIIFGNWSDLIVGDQLGLETYTTLEGSWKDEDGMEHSAFDENLAATRALMYADVGVRHPESFLVARNCMVPGATHILEAQKATKKGDQEA